LADVAALIQVEDDDGKIIVLAEGGWRSSPSLLRSLLQDVHVGDMGEFLGVLHLHWIGVVNAIDFCVAFYDDVGLDFPSHAVRQRVSVEK